MQAQPAAPPATLAEAAALGDGTPAPDTTPAAAVAPAEPEAVPSWAHTVGRLADVVYADIVAIMRRDARYEPYIRQCAEAAFATITGREALL